MNDLIFFMNINNKLRQNIYADIRIIYMCMLCLSKNSQY